MAVHLDVLVACLDLEEELVHGEHIRNVACDLVLDEGLRGEAHTAAEGAEGAPYAGTVCVCVCGVVVVVVREQMWVGSVGSSERNTTPCVCVLCVGR